PRISLEHQLVDSCALRLVQRPADFDVIVTENLFGDILTDLTAVLGGSIGMLPSASLGERGPGLYEPVHGSAPDIAGRGLANPYGAIGSVSLLLRHSLHLEDESAAVDAAIGAASTWTETMPCNFHLRRLAERVKEGIRSAGATPMEFNTIAISDGVTMGTEGMKASLVSREVIADSIELVGRGHLFDAMVTLVACDKTIPGGAMALLRLDVPSLLLYGGSIAPGRFDGRDVTIQDVFEAVGAHAAGKLPIAKLKELEDVACPGSGACGGQYTANTMALAMEVLGLSPPGYATIPALDDGTAG